MGFLLPMILGMSGESLGASHDRIVLPSDVVPTHYAIAITPYAAALAFDGHVAIDVNVRTPTRTVELNAAGLTFRHVALSGANGQPAISFDANRETVTLAFSAPVSIGAHVLTIDYSGTINQHPSGLFALDYDTGQGRGRALFTQFENSDARRFVPCWDEPALKATFDLTAIVPSGEMAVSNMPIAAKDRLSGGLTRIHFGTSPEMSSYLLFFGVGDFERISKKVDGVDVGVIVKRGDTAQGQFALDAAAHLLPYYESYFDVKYPLPKLDLIAGPGESQSYGAMENWGAIFSFESDLLIDAKLSTEADRRNAYIVIAHEMSHQWFGDLVTMQWWDDIWLNEGFASWMELKATDHLHPEWHVWMDALDEKEDAIELDARVGTHPIITPIRDVVQADEAFDTITYEKGMSVIRMLESYLGEDRFRAGVRAYIKAHAYGNTVSDDLWRELDKIAPAPITPMAHAFTLQSGVPLIRATDTEKRLHLVQDRFAEDDSARAPATWPVPVAVGWGKTSHWKGIVSHGRPADIALPAGAVARVNDGQTGYFRTLYDATLLGRLKTSFAALTPADQLGLLNDLAALGYAGYRPLGDYLSLARDAPANCDPLVLRSVADEFQNINRLYDGLPGQATFQAFGRSVLRPLLARIGWTARAGEADNIPLLRASLLSALSELDDADVIGEARRRFQIYLANPASLAGDLRKSVVAIVATHADASEWDALHALARSANSALDKSDLYAKLGIAKDAGLARRALALALTPEVRMTTKPTIVQVVAYRFPHLAMDFAVAHLDELDRSLEPDSRPEYIPELAGNSQDDAMIGKLRAFAEQHIPASARSAAEKAEGEIAIRAKIRARQLPGLDHWLGLQFRN